MKTPVETLIKALHILANDIIRTDNGIFYLYSGPDNSPVSYSRHIARRHIRLLKSRIKSMEKFLEETNKTKAKRTKA